jgi:hypothetical protein
MCKKCKISLLSRGPKDLKNDMELVNIFKDLEETALSHPLKKDISN